MVVVVFSYYKFFLLKESGLKLSIRLSQHAIGFCLKSHWSPVLGGPTHLLYIQILDEGLRFLLDIFAHRDLILPEAGQVQWVTL